MNRQAKAARVNRERKTVVLFPSKGTIGWAAQTVRFTHYSIRTEQAASTGLNDLFSSATSAILPTSAPRMFPRRHVRRSLATTIYTF